MSKNYMNDSQASEIVKYISDTMKLPLIGAGGGFAPIGKEGYVDGTLAPEGWLICDGSTHNIADYPELAAYFASHHGSSNYYGGDGVTTFAVPTRNGMPTSGVETPDEHIVGEWREEFDGVLKYKPVYKKVLTYDSKETSIDISSLNIDKIVNFEGFYDSGSDVFPIDRTATNFNYQSGKWINGKTSISLFYGSNVGTVTQLRITLFYTKTTDTYQPVQEGHSADGNGVFCIKATVSGDANAHQYSTEEQVVGMTEDGEVVYEKTIKFDDKSFSSGSDTNVPHGVSNIGESWINRLIWRDNDGTSRPMIPYCDGNLNSRIVFRSITSTNIVFRTNGDSWSSSDYDYVKVTIRYTKTSS